jgi:hypothetical protein
MVLKKTTYMLMHGRKPIREEQYMYSNMNITVNQFEQKIKDLVSKLKREGHTGFVQTSMLIPHINWRNGKKIDIQTGEARILNIRDYVDSDEEINEDDRRNNILQWYNDGHGKLTDFGLYVTLTNNQQAGGTTKNKNNDCLYYTLSIILGDKFTTEFINPYKLKQFLGVKKGNKIPLDLLYKIEERLNINIFVSCDNGKCRYPTKNRQCAVYLKLRNEHYSVDESHLKKRDYLCPPNEKKVIFYTYHPEDILKDGKGNITKTPAFHTYYYGEIGEIIREFNKDGEEYGGFKEDIHQGEPIFHTTSDEKEEKEFLKKLIDSRYNYFSSKEIYIHEKDKNKLVSSYNEFIYNANELKKITDLNMFKTGSIKDTCVDFFNKYNNSVETEEISVLEEDFIKNCYRGPLLYAQKGYTGKAHKCDISSAYPAILISLFTLPIKRGTFHFLDDDEFNGWKSKNEKNKGQRYFKYGIYRCVITSENKNKNKLFTFNEKNYYTHIDLETAYKHNFNIELIHDNKPNFLHYENKCNRQAKLMFKKFVDTLYEIKKTRKDITYTKKLLNMLWGALCEHKISKQIVADDRDTDNIYVKENGEEIHYLGEVDENLDIKDHRVLNNHRSVIEFIDNRELYRTNYARLGPFLTAKQRQIISDYACYDIENVIRIHTDSIISSKKFKFEMKNKEDCEIGEMGYEGFTQNCIINYVHDVKGF